MPFRTLIGCAVVLPLACGSAALAHQGEGHAAGRSAALMAFNMPAVSVTRRSLEGSVVLAQATEPQINDLQEQIRQLNGKVEELNFQILQMQDQLRKKQQDDEFRFEQLEKKRSDAGASAEAPHKEARADAPVTPTGKGSTGRDVKSIIEAPDASATVSEEGANDAGGDLGTPPRDFGTIKFDAKGNPVGATVAPDATGGASRPRSGGATVASLPAGEDADELYRNSYQLILSGDYKSAESGFREHISRFPNDSHAADAHFWLGEALLGQDRYREAAQTFLDGTRAYPKSKKAPDMMLKLGVSLSAMNQRDIACSTYREIGQRYPQASNALKERVKQEEALAGC
jgi:tol-pal system protein YbgF